MHKESDPSLEKYKKRCEEMKIGGSSWYQTLLFTWLHPLLNFGNKQTVEVEMMPKLPEK